MGALLLLVLEGVVGGGIRRDGGEMLGVAAVGHWLLHL